MRKEFKYIDETTFFEGKDNYRLIVGICAHVQQKIENEEDMIKAFDSLSDVERITYALGYVFEDSRNALSDFFRANGEPLLSTAETAVSQIIGGRFADVFLQEYSMFDESNETISVDEREIERLDNEFRSIIAEKGHEIYLKSADFVRQNKHDFI